MQVTPFIVYLDDSGTSPEHPVATSTALVIPSARIAALENEWDTLRKKEQFTIFHTSEFVFKNHHSEFADWLPNKQQKVFSRVRQIIKKFGVKVFSFAVHKGDYDAIMPNNLRKYTGEYHYTWAVRFTIAQIAQWRSSRQIGPPLEYVFDWMEKNKPRRIEIENVMDQSERAAREDGRAGEYSNYSFRKRKELAGLQCVDCLAWTCYQMGLHGFLKKPMHYLASIAWKDFVSKNDVDLADSSQWLTVSTVTGENLRIWVWSETANESMKRFQRWEREK